jgi:alpha-2-macroglobulin
VVVVDEAILALSNYQLRNPLDSFYFERPLDLYSVYGRASIVLANPLDLAQAQDMGVGGAPMATQSVMSRQLDAGAPMMESAAAAPEEAKGMQDGDQNQQPAIRVRSDFNPLAIFAPSVRTGSDGSAQVTVKVPDNLTRYRVMVVAVEHGKRYGTGESSLTARLPLMVRPSAPRFLNFGDRFELPVVLQNQTDEDMQVEVVARASNLALTGVTGMRVTVPARDRVEVRFPAAAEMAGTARIQIAAVGNNGYADAATLQLPVYTPATTEAFATYGVLDNGAVAQPVNTPQGVFPQFGGLEISTSSTALQALTDAVLYLVAYPYEYSEQIASRILAIAALRDVLTAFEAEGLPEPAELEATVQRDIEMLQTLQNNDGGFPYWRHGQESAPYNSIHVSHALVRAQAKGFNVPAELIERAMVYLKDIESHYPSWYYKETRWTLSAYALYVRNLSGDRDPQKALRLIDEAGLENLSLDSIGWLWPVLQDASGTEARLTEIRLLVANRVVETAGAANFTTQYDDQNYLLLGSDRRTDAILLDALIGDNPNSDLIPKLVNGLLAHRTRGRWGNTQENVFVLLGLDRYFNTYESQTPDFVARIWLGEAYAGDHSFQGYTTERSQVNVPMDYLVNENPGAAGQSDLILSKEGAGRLYYRLGMRYAPTDLRLPALDMGFVVQRSYEAVDDPADVRLDENGVWHIRAGARVRVRLSMVADNRRYHVALSDPLPAGLEIINPELAVYGGLPADAGSSADDPLHPPVLVVVGPVVPA